MVFLKPTLENTIMRNALAALLVAVFLAGCTENSSTQAPPEAKQKSAVVKTPISIEASSDKGVKWLLGQQSESGSYGEFAQVGLTSFVVAAALTSPDAQAYRDDPRVKKAVAYLAAQSKEDGSIQPADDRKLANYQTAAALTALSLYGGEEYKAVREKAKQFLLKIQNANPEDAGSWGYNGSGRGDLSNTQFSLEALRAAGLPEDSDAFKRCVAFIDRCQNRSESNPEEYSGDDGGAMYFPGSSKAGVIELENGKKIFRSYGSMTYALLRSYILCGVKPDDARVKAALTWLTDNYTLDVNPGMPEEQKLQGLYYYYLTMAKALPLAGVKTLKLKDGTEVNWAKELSDRLISLQREDGSWVNAADRWYEGDPTLVTAYALSTLAECRKVLEAK